MRACVLGDDFDALRECARDGFVLLTLRPRDAWVTPEAVAAARDHRTHTRSRSEVGDDAHGETSAIEDGDHEGSSSSGGTSADEVEAGKAELKPMPSPQGTSSLRRRVAKRHLSGS